MNDPVSSSTPKSLGKSFVRDRTQQSPIRESDREDAAGQQEGNTSVKSVGRLGAREYVMECQPYEEIGKW
jgi:hypothetical protein